MTGLVDDNPSLRKGARRLKAFTRLPNIFPLDVHDCEFGHQRVAHERYLGSITGL